MRGGERHTLFGPTRRLVVVGLLAAPVPAHAARAFAATVTGITRYGDLRLSDERIVRLSDLDLLRPPAPFGLQVQSGLKAMALGRDVQVEPTTTAPDRFGNIPAHVRLGDGASLQGEMVRLGLARLRPRTKPRKGLPDLADWFELEDDARARGRGLWSDDAYAVRAPDADALAQLMDSFQIVEGIVVATGGPKARTYLNFGSDWRTDVTVVVERKLEKHLPEPVRGLAGARVEARGWIEMVNGPSIWLEDARALRILS